MTSDAPVVFIVYNRLHTTAPVFERIAAARPSTLLIVADGPKPEKPDDPGKCQAVRDLVTRPSWPCDLRLNLADRNLGFKRRISSGLAWAFSQFEEVIVIEDDCLPDPSLFPFCAEMLARYRHDERVMMVAGCSFQFGRKRGDASYYFSHGVGTWGWASWRRAFRLFDPDLTQWPSLRDTDMLSRIWPDPTIVSYWRDRFDETYRGEVDAWDYQWAFAMWRNRALQVAPNSNLVTYLGCLPDTAHTTDVSAPFCAIPSVPMEFPLVHPTSMTRDLAADVFEFYRVFLNEPDGDAQRKSLLPMEGGTAGCAAQSTGPES